MSSPPLTFTGERLVPGQVDRQLLAEHVARYQLALHELRTSLPAGAAVADLACGTGYGTGMLAEAGFTAQGVDLSAEAVAWASAAFASTGARFSTADVTATTLEDASQQGITAFEILEHLEDPDGLLREIVRLLAPGGVALVSTPNPDAHEIAGENEFHHHEYTLSEFQALLRQHFPGWNATILGQRRSGAGGSGLLVRLRKGYIALKRALGIGAILAKPQAEWTPGQTYHNLPHGYRFTTDALESAEYLIAILRRPVTNG